MSARRQVVVNVIMTALNGMFHPGLTDETKEEKGTPRSRAKDHFCRDTFATVLMHAKMIFTMTMLVITMVATLLLVALRKTWMKGHPVAVEIVLPVHGLE